jgi:hypothetical protein
VAEQEIVGEGGLAQAKTDLEARKKQRAKKWAPPTSASGDGLDGSVLSCH